MVHGGAEARLLKCLHLPSSLQGGKVIDSVMIVKDKHSPEAWV